MYEVAFTDNNGRVIERRTVKDLREAGDYAKRHSCNFYRIFDEKDNKALRPGGKVYGN